MQTSKGGDEPERKSMQNKHCAIVVKCVKENNNSLAGNTIDDTSKYCELMFHGYITYEENDNTIHMDKRNDDGRLTCNKCSAKCVTVKRCVAEQNYVTE